MKEYIKPLTNIVSYIEEIHILGASTDEGHQIGSEGDVMSKENDFTRELDNYKDIEIPISNYNPWED
ncbi:MAG: hypothetical protein ACI4A7_10180 [Prevotella sp.]